VRCEPSYWFAYACSELEFSSVHRMQTRLKLCRLPWRNIRSDSSVRRVPSRLMLRQHQRAALMRKSSGGARVFAARGKRLVAAPPIRSAIDILMVTTMSLAQTVTNSTLSWGCYYVMQIPAESVLQCKRQFARSGRISEFHISPLQMPPPAQCRPGRMSPSPPLAATAQERSHV